MFRHMPFWFLATLLVSFLSEKLLKTLAINFHNHKYSGGAGTYKNVNLLDF